MNVAIISIGDELLIGQVINKNASWIAEQVTDLGATVVRHAVIGDDKSQLVSELDRASGEAQIILVTGGLGPTHDDLTKFVLADITSDQLVENQQWVEHLQSLMNRMGRELTERNRSQALVPSNAVVLHNEYGTAPALQIEYSGATVVAMPGVPVEMQYVMNHSVLPMMRELVRTSVAQGTLYHTIHTTGIAESTLADLIGEPNTFVGASSLAFLPNLKGVRLRIGATGNSAPEREAERDRIREVVFQKASRFIFGEGTDTLAEVVGKKLLERNETVSVAESCTSGLLGAAFTDVSGSSAWFEGGLLTYSNQAKISQLGVDANVLDAVGAVSAEVAEQMARRVKNKFSTSWGIGITGIAGPQGGTDEKPVGLVFISVCGERSITKRFVFGKDRAMNRERSVGAALSMLWTEIR